MRRLLMLAFTLILALTAAAQVDEGQYYIKVTSFRSLPLDMDARIQAPMTDQNGIKCALVKVTTNIKGLTFESPAMGIVHQRYMQNLGEVWVYIPVGSKNVSIFHSQCKPIRNYSYQEEIVSAAVYEMVLESNLPEEFQYKIDDDGDIITNENVFRNVRFTVNPTNARILLRNMPQQTDSNGNLITEMPLGRFHYRATAENHYDYEGVFEVRNDDEIVSVDIELKMHTGILDVRTQPSGASIFIDNKEIGQTPFLSPHEVTIGKHEIKTVLANHKTEIREVVIRRDELTSINLTLTDIAKMTIDSHPSGAKIFINGEASGTTPFLKDMPSGDYDILLKKNKYCDYRERVHLDSSNPTRTFSLQRQFVNPTSAYLQPVAQFGCFNAVGLQVGGYFDNINVEASYLLGLNESEMIYWNTPEGDEPTLGYTYKAKTIGGKIGYGIIHGRRIRITPQIGAGIVKVTSYNGYNNIPSFDASQTYAVSASVGVKCEYAFSKFASVYLSPEYSHAVKKGKYFSGMESISTKVKHFADGLNARLGISVFL